MDQIEVERLIGELETTLDRLRSLYEQYFMGIERIEPGVVRKDVDRRFYVLRKEQIRNTALRYRFQMLLQKYNTYQTHWQRVCREIENGTYKRHLMRAQRRFGSSHPPRRRSSLPPADRLPEPGASLPQGLAVELAELDRDFGLESVDVEIPLDDDPSSRPPPRRSPEVPDRPAIPPFPGLPSSAVAAPVAPPPRPPGGAPVWKKVAPGPPALVPPQAGAGLQQAPATPLQTAPRSAPSGFQPPPGMVPSGAAPVRPVAAPRPTAGGPPPAPPAARPAPSPAASATKPVAPAQRLHAGSPPPPYRPVDAGAQPAPYRPQPPRPTPSAPPRNLAAAPSPRPSPAAGELSEKRLRQIYVEYVDAKRRQNESTAAITFESVAKSLRESGGRLRQKHGKDVDFEVAVKDGKTILRPVLK